MRFSILALAASPSATAQNIALEQTIGLWGKNVTATGTKEFHWDFSQGFGSSGTVKGNIPVDSTVAYIDPSTRKEGMLASSILSDEGGWRHSTTNS